MCAPPRRGCAARPACSSYCNPVCFRTVCVCVCAAVDVAQLVKVSARNVPSPCRLCVPVPCCTRPLTRVYRHSYPRPASWHPHTRKQHRVCSRLAGCHLVTAWFGQGWLAACVLTRGWGGTQVWRLYAVVRPLTGGAGNLRAELHGPVRVLRGAIRGAARAVAPQAAAPHAGVQARIRRAEAGPAGGSGVWPRRVDRSLRPVAARALELRGGSLLLLHHADHGATSWALRVLARHRINRRSVVASRACTCPLLQLGYGDLLPSSDASKVRAGRSPRPRRVCARAL